MTPALLRRTALGLAAAAAGFSARAQTILPDQTLDILVGFQATGGMDLLARRIAARLENRLGRRVNVDNRSGAAGALAGDVLTRQPADGTAIALLASTSLLTRLINRDFPFDPVRELTPITLLGTWPIGLAASPTIDVKTFGAYIAWLKAGDAARGRLGNSASDVFFEVFERTLRKAFDVSVAPVRFPGATSMIHDLDEGSLPAAVGSLVSMLPDHRGRRLRLLMTTGDERLVVAPDIPTAREVGVGELQTTEWYGFFARAGTPQPLIDEWNRQLVAVMDNRAAAAELAVLGLTVTPSTPKQLGARLELSFKQWRARMLAVGLQPVEG